MLKIKTAFRHSEAALAASRAYSFQIAFGPRVATRARWAALSSSESRGRNANGRTRMVRLDCVAATGVSVADTRPSWA